MCTVCSCWILCVTSWSSNLKSSSHNRFGNTTVKHSYSKQLQIRGRKKPGVSEIIFIANIYNLCLKKHLVFWYKVTTWSLIKNPADLLCSIRAFRLWQKLSYYIVDKLTRTMKDNHPSFPCKVQMTTNLLEPYVFDSTLYCIIVNWNKIKEICQFVGCYKVIPCNRRYHVDLCLAVWLRNKTTRLTYTVFTNSLLSITFDHISVSQ